MFQLQTAFFRTLMFGQKLAGYLIPTTPPLLFCGPGSSQQLATTLAQQGVKKLLLVTDQALFRLGLAEKMLATLAELGVETAVFYELTPDPTDQQIQAGIEAARYHGAEAVLGFGGGSAIDAAKLIAALAPRNLPLDNAPGLLRLRRRGLALYAVPTTAGTGSEVTFAAVITHSQSHQKKPVIDPCLLPSAVALDPTLMTGLPPAVTAATGIDALTHAIEALLSNNANRETNRLARAAMGLIFTQLPVAYRDGNNLEARSAMAIAACYAGLAFTKAGVGYVHAIAHQLGAYYHLPHGLANAKVLPQVLALYNKRIPGRLAALARQLALPGDNDQALADAFCQQVTALITGLGIHLGVAELQARDIEAISRQAQHEAHWLYAVPLYLKEDELNALVASLSAGQ